MLPTLVKPLVFSAFHFREYLELLMSLLSEHTFCKNNIKCIKLCPSLVKKCHKIRKNINHIFYFSHSKQVTQEVREGPTYASNIEDDDVDLTTIPPPMPHPGTDGLDTADAELVYFDLETTGLSIFLCLYHIFMSSVILHKDYLCSLIMELKVKA